MGGDALPILKKFDSGCGVASFKLLTGKVVRNAVVMPVDLYVIVDVGTDRFPLGHYIGFGRQWLKGGTVDVSE